MPDITVNDSVELNLGNRVLTVSAFSTAHTDNDLIVFDQKTKTLWTGDLLFIERTPSLDGSIVGWLDAMKNWKKFRQNSLFPVTVRYPTHGRTHWRHNNTIYKLLPMAHVKLFGRGKVFNTPLRLSVYPNRKNGCCLTPTIHTTLQKVFLNWNGNKPARISFVITGRIT